MANKVKFKPGDKVIISKDSKNVWIQGKKATVIRFLEEDNVPGSFYQWTYEVKLEDGDKCYVPQWELELESGPKHHCIFEINKDTKKHKFVDDYGEIVRLRNEAYKKWMETPTDDEYNRVVTKAKFQAYEKCMELLQPVVIPHRQTEENGKFDGWDYLLKRNEELVRENTQLKNYLRQVYFLMRNIKENDSVSLDLKTKIASVVGTIEEALNFDK